MTVARPQVVYFGHCEDVLVARSGGRGQGETGAEPPELSLFTCPVREGQWPTMAKHALTLGILLGF